MRIQRTVFHWVLEGLALLLLIVTEAVFFAVLPGLPERVPTNFSASGEIVGWGGVGSLWTLFALIAVGWLALTVVGFFPGSWNLGLTGQQYRALRSTGFRTVSLPGGSRIPAEKLYAMALTLLLELKMGLLFLLGGLLCFACTLSPLPPWFFPVALTILLLPLAVYLVRIAIGK